MKRRIPFVGVAIVCLGIAAACGLNATWTRTYHPAGWNQVEVRGLEPLPGGQVLLFGSVADYSAPANTTDVFLAAFDADGALVWDRIYDFGDTDIPMNIAVDHAGNSVVWDLGDDTSQIVAFSATGDIRWQQPGRFFDAAFTGGDVVLATGDSVLRLAADGSVVWQRAVDDRDARFVALDGAGNTYVAGSVIEPGNADADVAPVDAWLAKLGPGGSLLWQRSAGAPDSSDSVGGLAALADGRVALTAEVQLTADYSGVVTRMYSADGAVLWHDEYANTDAFDNYPEDLGIDTDGNVLVLSMSNSLSSGPWNSANDERVVTKLTPSGAIAWRKVRGGFTIVNPGVLVHSLYHDDDYVYATGGEVTRIYDRGNGKEVARIDDGTLENNYLAFDAAGEVYFATTDDNDAIVKRYHRPD